MAEPEIHIEGGRIKGKVTPHASKNTALPELGAALLSNENVHISHIPDITDVNNLMQLITRLGGYAVRENGDGDFNGSGIEKTDIPEEFTKLRASYYVVPALLAKQGEAGLYLPVGCEIGKRPIDFHIKGWKQMGVEVEENDHIQLYVPNGLHGADINLEKSSVGATLTLMMTATQSDDETIIRNAAIEPEVIDTADLLIKMGADITYDPNKREITINGPTKLEGCKHRVPYDRIEIWTLMVAAAITHGRITIENLFEQDIKDVQNIMDVLEQTGVTFEVGKDYIKVTGADNIRPYKGTLVTAPHPGFPTDMQAILCAYLTQANGTSYIEEKVFEDRTAHADGLNNMRADITVSKLDFGHSFEIKCPTKLHGAKVTAPDLRGGAAYYLAALCAEGETIIMGHNLVKRGYENLEKTLFNLGARKMNEWNV